MNFSDLSIRNPVFAVMLAAAMIVFGWMGYRDLGVSQFPEIDFPVISITITREAAGPEVMDGDVTGFIEEAVAGVEGVETVISKSLEGTSLVIVYFRLNRNVDIAMQDVENAVASARRRLPPDIDPPIIAKVNPNDQPVMWITLSGALSLVKISDFAEKEFKENLAVIQGVGGIQFGGLQSRNIRIWLDAGKLSSYNLAVDEVVDTLKKQHAELPAGYIQSNYIEFNLRTMGEAYTLKDMEKLIIAQKNDQPIRLSDVAWVENGLEDKRSLARFNRMPAVAVGIRKAIGGNLVAVCENIKKDLPRLQKLLPPGVRLDVPVDTSIFVRESVDELKLTLFLGIVLTAAVCFLFLGSLGTTVNICLSIPTSLLGTFFFINYGVKMLGLEPFTINLMTLLALSLSVGVVVDDAILVLENIVRHRQMRMKQTASKDGGSNDQMLAAKMGAKEIAFAAIAATFSIIAIFLPVAFMKGTIGKFFFQFGVTVSVAVFLSLVCALTLTPMLCAWVFDVKERIANRPRPRKWLFGIVVAIGIVGLMSILRATSTLWPIFKPIGWWGSELSSLLFSWLNKPLLVPEVEKAIGGSLAMWWGVHLAVEFVVTAILVRYLSSLYWLLDRFLLCPLLIHPMEWFLTVITKGYARSLRWAVQAWPIVLIISGGLIFVAALMIWGNLIGKELIPSEDQSRFLVHVVCPVGSSIQQVDELLQECETILVNRADIQGLLTTVATEPGSLINEADLYVQLIPHAERKISQRAIMREVRTALEEVRDITVVVRDLSTEGFTAQRGDPIDFAVQADWSKLPGIVQKITDELIAEGIVQDLDTDYRPGQVEVQLFPNRDKLSLVNVSTSKVADSVSLLVGGQRIAKFTDKGRRYDIRARLRSVQRNSPDQLNDLLVRGGNNQLIPLSDLVERRLVSTLPVIHRYAYQRKIEITANPAPGLSQGEAIDRTRAIIEKHLQGVEGLYVELGNAQAMRATIDSLIFALVLGILIAYMILAVQFKSYIHPLTVLLAMPFALTGALVTLWMTGDTLNMMSLIGLVLLMGLVKKNSIILVDYTNQVREGLTGDEHGESAGSNPSVVKREPVEAVLYACPIRLRPILMTSIATIAGAIPAALGLGPGAETRAPMARAIIGGIILSTLVTLYLVPVFYVLVERLRKFGSTLVR